MDEIRAEAPDTIVIITADNGAWQDAWPDAGVVPFRGEKGSPFEGGFRVPGIMWCAGQDSGGRALWRDDVAYRRSGRRSRRWSASRRRPMAHGRTTTASRSISTASTTAPTSLGKAKHSARTSWIYVDGETFAGARADIGDDPENPDLHIAWKYLYTAKDTWLGPQANLGAHRLDSTTSPWTRSRNTT